MPFSISSAAFRGFRLLASRPGLIAAWSGFYVLAVVGIIALLFGIGVALALTAAGADGPRPFSDQMSGPVIALMAGMVAFFLVFSSVMVTAVFRAVLRPDESRFAYVRFGMDELRQVGLTLVLWLFAALMVIAPLFLISFLTAGQGAGGAIVWLAALPVLLCGWLFLGVKLSLAPVMTFAERGFRIGDSWEVTRGRFWPLLGAWVLVLVLSLGVTLVSFILTMIFRGMFLAQFSTFGTDPASALTGMGPMVVVGLIGYLGVTLVSNVVQLGVVYAPQADAYQQIVRPKTTTVSDVFL